MFYKILHIPTGLFYKPSKYSSKGNLSKKGKVYQTKPSIEKWLLTQEYYPPRVYYSYLHPMKEYPYCRKQECKLEDWKIIEYKEFI